MALPKPTSMSRAKEWSPEAEEAYRFQTAGYRDEVEYKELKKNTEVYIRINEQLYIKTNWAAS